MRPLGARRLTLVVAPIATIALLAGAMGGCSWLLGVSEDPVVGDLSIDAAGDAAKDRPDVEEAAVEDAPVE